MQQSSLGQEFIAPKTNSSVNGCATTAATGSRCIARRHGHDQRQLAERGFFALVSLQPVTRSGLRCFLELSRVMR
jgi:hypothetical protein